jgi:hypothetical protein
MCDNCQYKNNNHLWWAQNATNFQWLVTHVALVFPRRAYTAPLWLFKYSKHRKEKNNKIQFTKLREDVQYLCGGIIRSFFCTLKNFLASLRTSQFHLDLPKYQLSTSTRTLLGVIEREFFVTVPLCCLVPYIRFTRDKETHKKALSISIMR